MKIKFKVLSLALLLILTSCQGGSSSEPSSSTPSEDVSSQTSLSESSDSSNETTSATSENGTSSEGSSETLTPLPDTQVAGLTKSEVWPSAALGEYLSYYEDAGVPSFTSEVSFYHGIHYNYLELDFYRVFTRVRKISDFHDYIGLFESYGFSADEEADENGDPSFYLVSMYDEVRLYLQAMPKNGYFEVSFDFYDGDGDSYDGLRAEDNVAFFNLRNEAAVTSKSPTVVKWEVRPAKFTVRKGTAGYSVGGDNYSQLSNQLHIYAGNIVNFIVSEHYVIDEIYILSQSYLDEFLDEGEFNDPGLEMERVGPDNVKLYPSNGVSNLEYKRFNVMNVGQTRFMEVKITFSSRYE